jgi:hypothetical protein
MLSPSAEMSALSRQWGNVINGGPTSQFHRLERNVLLINSTANSTS